MEELQTATPARLGAPGTYYLVNGEPAVNMVDLKISNATFDGLLDYIRARKAVILSQDPDIDCGAHLTVCDRTQEITLKMMEHGGLKGVGTDYDPAVTVHAKAQFSDDHTTVQALLKKQFSADGLATEIRKLRHLFGTKLDHEALFKKLRNTQHKVERIVETTSNDLGARKKGFDEQIVNADVIAFQLKYAIHEGEEPKFVNVEVVYQIQGGDVVLSLLAVDLLLDEREAVKAMMSRTIDKIKEHLGEALPIIRLN